MLLTIRILEVDCNDFICHWGLTELRVATTFALTKLPFSGTAAAPLNEAHNTVDLPIYAVLVDVLAEESAIRLNSRA